MHSVKNSRNQNHARSPKGHIESVLPIVRKNPNDSFYSIKLIVDANNTAKIIFTDGNSEDSIHTENIKYTDFALPGQYKFFLCANEINGFTLMLSSEY